MLEVSRQVFQDKNKNPYIIMVNKKDAREYEGYVYKLEKEEYGFEITDRVGLLMLERKTDDTFETLYDIEKNYRGLGLGKKLVELSKEIALKEGARFIKLNKLRREVIASYEPTLKIDANLSLYLSMGFRLLNDYNCCYQSADMICDLFKEKECTIHEKMKMFLDNSMSAYSIMDKIDREHDERIKFLDESLLK